MLDNGHTPRNSFGGSVMISEISILNHKSFHPTQSTRIFLETENRKPVFFYGQNGAGKTAIGEVIRGLAVGDPKFTGCKVTTVGEGRFRFHVYNHEFVQSVIGEAEGMPGIFTIGETDVATQKEIERQEQISKDADEATEAARVAIEAIDALLDKALITAQDEVWKAFKAYDTGDFAGYLKGYGRGKPKFFEELRKLEVSPDEELDDIGELIRRLADVSGDEQPKAKHSLSTGSFSLIEAHELWQEVVEVSSDSSLSALIEALKNADWVDKGRSFVQEDQCPFCQQGLPHGFMDELLSLFEGTRQEKIESIASYVTSYATDISNLERQIASALAEPLAKETDLKVASEAVIAKLKANLATMRLKQERPGESFEVACVDMGLMTEALDALNTRIGDFNRRIANKGEERKAVGEVFWKILYRDRAHAYTSYDAAVAPLNEQRGEWVIKQKAASSSKGDAADALAGLKKNQEGVDASVAAINTRLKGLGIDTFTIDRKAGEGSLYCLKRPGLGESTTQSLSEGEKTLISFFYFMELLKGAAEKGQSIDLARTIVVIDDPISSLSHNYVYDIASVIVQELIKPPGGQKVRQVLALTHNLFFLHELVLQLGYREWATVPKKCQLLRVVKNDCSQVMPMSGQEFANDYDALWQTIRDVRDGRVPVQVMPNTMRCVVETFFAFTGRRKEMSAVLGEMSKADATFKPLERYLHRGSHRDEVNIAHVDWGQFDLNYYFAKLEMLFDRAGHQDHYKMKMGLLEIEALGVDGD